MYINKQNIPKNIRLYFIHCHFDHDHFPQAAPIERFTHNICIFLPMYFFFVVFTRSFTVFIVAQTFLSHFFILLSATYSLKLPLYLFTLDLMFFSTTRRMSNLHEITSFASVNARLFVSVPFPRVFAYHFDFTCRLFSQ